VVVRLTLKVGVVVTDELVVVIEKVLTGLPPVAWVYKRIFPVTEGGGLTLVVTVKVLFGANDSVTCPEPQRETLTGGGTATVGCGLITSETAERVALSQPLVLLYPEAYSVVLAVRL
jgi:hypothetical protein